MPLTVGRRLASTVCETEIIVLRADGVEAALSCGGAPMTEPGSPDAHAGSGAVGDGTQVGKRYVDADGRLEVLCTKAGAGGLALDGVPLTIKAAKSLPSSD